MTRRLHEQDVLTLTDEPLHAILADQLGEDSLLVAAETRDLQPLLPVPVHNQTQLIARDAIDLDADVTIHLDPIYTSQRDQPSHLPHDNTERSHHQPASYETVALLMPQCGYFQRARPFHDLARVTKPGGTLLAATGLQPTHPSDHDAKFWVPDTTHGNLEDLIVTRHDDAQTPNILSRFTITDTPDDTASTVTTTPTQPTKP